MTAEQKARAIQAEALNVAEDALGDHPQPGLTPGWESLAHLRLVLAIEAHRGAPLDAEQIFNLASLNAIAGLLESETGD